MAFFSSTYCRTPGTIGGETYTNDLDEAVKLALLHQGRYFRGECIGEGHIILGQEEKSGITTVFALTNTRLDSITGVQLAD